MSASESLPVAARYCYFADYEVSLGGLFLAWGQATLVYPVADAEAFDPADVLLRLRRQAAVDHGVAPAAIRIRALSRL